MLRRQNNNSLIAEQSEELRGRARSPELRAGLKPALLLSAFLLVPSQSWAQTTSVDGVSDEIVVTAMKREQTVQEIPGAVSAVSGAELEARGITDPLDLTKLVPNLTTDVWNGDVNLSLRGVGKTVNSAPGGVALHVDGVFQPRTTMANLIQTDMERVEILRGPQGTLYGRNANGGVVNYLTKAPGEEFGGFVQASYQNYDEYRLAGAVDLPVSDGLRLRLTGSHSDRNEGFIENILGGQDLDAGTNSMARLRVDGDISDNIDVSLSATYGEQDGSYVYFLSRGEPSAEGIAANPMLAGATPNPGPRTSTANSPVDGVKKYKALSGTVNFELSDNISLKSITAYQTFDFDFIGDFDASEFSLAIADRREAAKTFTQELNLIINAGSLSGVLGAFYMDDENLQDIQFDFVDGIGQVPAGGAPPRPRLGPGSGNVFLNLFETKSLGFFGDFTVDVSDRLHLFGGLRYSEDEVTLTQDNFLFVGTPVGPFVVPPTVCMMSGTDKWSSTTPRVGIQYDVSETSGLYASYSQGFKSGGYAFTGCQQTYEDEEVTSYEIGSKNAFADGALTLNAAAFYYDYTDLQVQQLVGFQFSTQNAPEARVYGLEIEAAYRPDDHWTFDGNIGISDAEFVEFSNSDILNPLGVTEDLEGRPLPFSPDMTLGLSGSYTTDPVIAGGPITLRTSINHKSRTYFREFGNDADSQEAYTLLDASIQWNSPNDDFSVRVFGKNLTGEDYFTGILSAAVTGARIARYGEPSRYGIELRANF